MTNTPATSAALLLLAALPSLAAAAAPTGGVVAADWPAAHARCRPVPLAHVKASGFLGQRILLNNRSLLAGLQSPFPRGFEARVAGHEPGPETRRLAADSDLYKWMEGAAYMVAITGDKEVEQALERIAGLVVACQKPDGYINTQVPPNIRFDPKVNHDLYTAGHFFEAAVAHYRATGRRHLLEAARRWADYLISEYKYGNTYFRSIGRREHSEYELGLLRLARATGESKYLDFSIALARMIPVGPGLLSGEYAGRAHAVRVNYLLSGYADLYLETGQEEFRQPLGALWDEIVDTRSYVTGGVSAGERYPKEAHYLPQVMDHPSRDIAETCTSIALIMFAWRMHGLTGDSRFFDQIETILYNHYLGGVALDNLGTFYYNPLRVVGDTKGKTDAGGPLTHRTILPAIHRTACCITNEWRFFGALSEYLYSYDGQGLYVNLYTAGQVRHTLPSGAEAALTVDTNYPHDGAVTIRFDGVKPARFALRLRIPKWCTSATIAVGSARPKPVEAGTYGVMERTWKPGDRVHLKLRMPVRMALPDPEDKENRGLAALARGPLVYCLEQRDAGFPVEQARWDFAPAEAARRVKAVWRGDLLGGVNILQAPGRAGGGKTRLTLIPFYTRANRGDDNRWTTLLPF